MIIVNLIHSLNMLCLSIVSIRIMIRPLNMICCCPALVLEPLIRSPRPHNHIHVVSLSDHKRDPNQIVLFAQHCYLLILSMYLPNKISLLYIPNITLHMILSCRCTRPPLFDAEWTVRGSLADEMLHGCLLMHCHSSVWAFQGLQVTS